MRLASQQRCELCERRATAGCREVAHLRKEVARAIAETQCRASRHQAQMPPVELTLWCPTFWREGRSHGRGA